MVDRYYRDPDDPRYREYESDRGSWAWLLPLLLIPLLIGGFLWWWNKSYNSNTAYNSPVNTSSKANTTATPSSGINTGVGGGPNNVKTSPSPTATYQDSNTTGDSSTRTTQTTNPDIGVGGGSQNVTMPTGAPNTGRGQ